jgi:CobQ-like glutamine amidotransferase family enzyme
LYRVPFPDTTSTLRIAYVGHITCDADPVMGHNYNTLNGLAEESIGLGMVVSPNESDLVGTPNITLEQIETHTLMHEFGHLFGLEDHYGGQYNSSETMGEETGYTHNANCSYGENRHNPNLIKNYTLCNGCKAVLIDNRNNYNHGN